MSLGNLFFVIGIAVAGLSILAAVVAAVIFHRSGKILSAKLEAEYGKRRR